MNPPGDMLIAYAAQQGAPALDGDDGGNSPYAKALIAHLAAPNVDVRILFERVRDQVVSDTGGRQKPNLSVDIGGNEIFLNRLAVGISGGDDSFGGSSTIHASPLSASSLPSASVGKRRVHLHQDTPELVVLPSGQFVFGSINSEEGHEQEDEENDYG